MISGIMILRQKASWVKISGVQAAIALCLFAAIPFSAQSGTSQSSSHGSTGTVRTESRIPGVTIRAVGNGKANRSIEMHNDSGQNITESAFQFSNDSGHNITALDVLLVPIGVPKRNGHYVCKGKCADKPVIGDIEHPSIPSGISLQTALPVGNWKGGAVVVEAAVFDDGTYAGSERAAAITIAMQLGNQAEFDRIYSAVEPIMAETEPQSRRSGAHINSVLAALPVAADAEQQDTFSRWFPNVQDCAHSFAQIMQDASSQEIKDVEGTLDPLLSKHSAGALTQWWSETVRSLEKYGCKGCSERTSAPIPPVNVRTISVGCKAGTSGGTSAGTDTAPLQAEDDSGMDDGDASDQSAADQSSPDPSSPDPSAPNNGDAGSGSNQTAGNDAANAAANGSDAASDASTATAAPEQSPTADTDSPRPVSSRCLPVAPRPMRFGGLPGAVEPSEQPLRPVTDERLYSHYFRYVEGWDRCIADSDWPESTLERYPDPFPPAMNDDQRQATVLMADDWVQTQRDSQADSQIQADPQMKMRPVEAGIPVQPLEGGSLRRPALVSLASGQTWARMQQGLQLRQQREQERDERVKLIESRLVSLRLAVGKTAFRTLDDYAHDLYHTVPGRTVRIPLSERAMYARYMHLIGAMDKFAVNENEDGQAAAKARAEEQVASGLNDVDERALQHEADSLRDLAEQRNQERRKNTDRSDPVAAEIRSMPALRPEERESINESLVESIQASLSKAGFEKLEKRVHALYDADGFDRVVPADQPDTATKQAETNESIPQHP